jgi:2-polyprenyl-3-methyl-5-hydroxy-6-metoxy-1,4-benzoquinol methylase
MNSRTLINMVRYVLEDIVPPAIRDSFFGYALNWLYYRSKTDFQTRFRQSVPTMTDAAYADYYRLFPGLDTPTDCDAECLDRLPSLVRGATILDVGSGRGFVADLMTRKVEARVSAIDFVISDEVRARYPKVEFHAGRIEALPFADRSFDTVICTHTLEHIADLHRAIRELRRVAKQRLIIVVPREREALYTFNLHIHFFPYAHSFLKYMMPLPAVHHCANVGRDILYYEDCEDAPPEPRWR